MLDLSGENVYFVSDTHFNHQKLCRGYPVHFDRTRTYETVEEMNEDIVSKWNSMVTEEDMVIFLGDFAYGRPFNRIAEIAKSYYERLKSKGMIWVRGNHDDILGGQFENLLPNLKFTYNGEVYLCQHEPYSENPTFLMQNPDATVLVHGHTHLSNKTSRVGGLVQNNVCWEAWYRPVHIDELVVNPG